MMTKPRTLLLVAAACARLLGASGSTLAQTTGARNHLKCYPAAEQTGSKFCTGPGMPLSCCTGNGTGTCVAPGAFKVNANLLRSDVCAGGTNDGLPCTPDTCSGGTNAGAPCTADTDCQSGNCQPKQCGNSGASCTVDTDCHIMCIGPGESCPPGFFCPSIFACPAPPWCRLVDPCPGGTCQNLSEGGCQIVGPPKRVCFPVLKQITSEPVPPKPGSGPTGGPTQPTSKFFCYALKCPSGLARTITGKDQFGTHALTIASAPERLCIPASPSGAFLDVSSAF